MPDSAAASDERDRNARSTHNRVFSNRSKQEPHWNSSRILKMRSQSISRRAAASSTSSESRDGGLTMKTVCAFARGAVVVSAIAAAGSAFAQSGDVNVYTYRESKLIQPLFDAFTRDTGVKVNVISASSGLEQRIKAEGANSPADVLLTVDIGRIEDAVRAGITQPIKSEVLDKIVAPQYRDPEGHWYGISMRARGLCLEGPREGDRPELRRPRRSEVEGQDLHPLRPVYLQQRAVCGLHRPSRRSQDRRMAQRPQSQSRAETIGRRPRGRPRHRGRQMRHRRRQYLLLGADAQQRARPQSLGAGD